MTIMADDISAGTEVSHQGYGYWEIDELIYDLFGK